MNKKEKRGEDVEDNDNNNNNNEMISMRDEL